MTKQFLVVFSVIGAAIMWAGQALNMMASAVVSPASERQCLDHYWSWCFYNQHPSFGWLGLFMLIAAAAALFVAVDRVRYMRRTPRRSAQ